MFIRVFAVLALVFANSPAFALEACFTDSVGRWRGPVLNGAGIETMDAEFHTEADGTLAGSYHVHDSTPFDGSLTGFRQTGSCEADFTWKDQFGTGTVHIRFEPEMGRFLGHWGLTVPMPWLIFNGYRYGHEVTS